MLAAIIALSLFGAPKPEPCPAGALMQCHDTRALVADPNFQLALQNFLGDAHERYMHGDKPLYGQILELLSTPEDHAITVGEDMKMFAGCKKLACPEKAALIIGEGGIKAIGVIDYSRGEPALEVIVRHHDQGEEAPEQVLHDWADACVTHQAQHDHANTSLHTTRVRALDDDDGPGGAMAPQRQSFFSLPRL